MSLVWHLITVDVRQHRWLVVTWLALILGGAGAATTLPALELSLGQREVIDIAKVLYGASGVLLGTLLVGLVLQSHSPVGAEAFWLTRPISAWVVLSTKAAVLGVMFVAVPSVAEAVRALVGGMPWTSVAMASSRVGLLQTLWLTLAAAAAVLTRSLARYFLLIFGGVVVVLLSIATTVAIQMARAEEATFVMATTSSSADGELVFLVLSFLGGIGVVVTQHMTRRRPLSVAVGALLLLAAFVVPDLWPFELSRRQEAASWIDSSNRPTLVMDTDSINTRGIRWGPPRDTAWRQIEARMRVEGVDPGWVVQATTLEASATLSSGELLRSPAGNSGIPLPSGSLEDATTAAIRSALKVERLLHYERSGDGRLVVMAVSDTDIARLAPTTASYSARFQLTPTQYTLAGTVPVRVGASHSSDAYELEVLGVRRVQNGLSARVRVGHEGTGFSYHVYYFRNRATAEAVAVYPVPITGGFTAPLGLELSGYTSQQLEFSAPGRNQMYAPQAAFQINELWLAKAELVIVRVTQAASVERKLAIASFPIKPPDADDNSSSRVSQ